MTPYFAVRELLETAATKSWWRSMTLKEQEAYLRAHPSSKQRPSASPDREYERTLKERDKRLDGQMKGGRGKEFSTEELTRTLHRQHDHLGRVVDRHLLKRDTVHVLKVVENLLNGFKGVHGGARAAKVAADLRRVRANVPKEYKTPPKDPCYRGLTLKARAVEALIVGKTLRLSDRHLTHWSTKVNIASSQSYVTNSGEIGVVLKKRLSPKQTLLNCIPMSRDFNDVNGDSLFSEVLCTGNDRKLNRVSPKDVASITVTAETAQRLGLPLPRKIKGALKYEPTSKGWRLAGKSSKYSN